jgi:hypothetical protein
MGGGLLEPILRRRAQRRISLDERGLLASRSEGRLVRGQGHTCALRFAMTRMSGLRKRLSGRTRYELTRAKRL